MYHVSFHRSVFKVVRVRHAPTFHAVGTGQTLYALLRGQFPCITSTPRAVAHTGNCVVDWTNELKAETSNISRNVKFNSHSGAVETKCYTLFRFQNCPQQYIRVGSTSFLCLLNPSLLSPVVSSALFLSTEWLNSLPRVRLHRIPSASAVGQQAPLLVDSHM